MSILAIQSSISSGAMGPQTPYNGGDGLVYIGSNSYITFGGGTNQLSGFSSRSPAFPKIMISASDNSLQKFYTLTEGSAPERTFRIRFQGTASPGGDPNNPTMIWEMVFYENISNQIDIHIADNARNLGGFSGVFTDKTSIATFANGVVYQSYRLTTTSESASISPISPDLHGADGMDLAINGNYDDTYWLIQFPFYVQYRGLNYGNNEIAPTNILKLDSNDPASYGGSGTIWTDVSGYDNDATLFNSPTFISGTLNYFNFDRFSLQYATAPNLGDLNRWSVEMWLRTQENLSNTGGTAAITTNYDASNKINFGILTGNQGAGGHPNLTGAFFDNNWYQTTGFAPTINNWNHVVVTYDGTVLKQYVNGSINSRLSATAFPTANSGEVRIARRWDGPSTAAYYFPGDIAKVAVYNDRLTPNDITTIWNNEKSAFGL